MTTYVQRLPVLSVIVELTQERHFPGIRIDDKIIVTAFLDPVRQLSVRPDVAVSSLELFDWHADRRVLGYCGLVHLTLEDRISVINVVDGDVDGRGVGVVAIRDFDRQDNLKKKILRLTKKQKLLKDIGTMSSQKYQTMEPSVAQQVRIKSYFIKGWEDSFKILLLNFTASGRGGGQVVSVLAF